jgi:hypothetical protein
VIGLVAIVPTAVLELVTVMLAEDAGVTLAYPITEPVAVRIAGAIVIDVSAESVVVEKFPGE